MNTIRDAIPFDSMNFDAMREKILKMWDLMNPRSDPAWFNSIVVESEDGYKGILIHLSLGEVLNGIEFARLISTKNYKKIEIEQEFNARIVIIPGVAFMIIEVDTIRSAVKETKSRLKHIP